MLVRRTYRPLDLTPAAFDRTFQQLVAGLATSGPRRPEPVVRASTTDGTLTLTVDLPGVPAAGVGVEVSGRTLTLTAEHEGATWSRRTRLGAQYDLDTVTANHVDGRLTVTVGPAAAPEVRQVTVSTSAPAAVEASSTPVVEPAEAVETGEVTGTGEVTEG